jgi:hypothetical protein
MKTRIVLAMMLVLVAMAAIGCTGAGTPASSDATPGVSEDSASATDTLAPEAATSEDAALIRGMGKSHKGETLQLLIIASEKSQAAADKVLLDTLPSFGDVQSYFVVEPTDHLKGLAPGLWVVFEAYREMPSAETIEFMDRGPSAAYLKQATVLCDDPIPVVEDLEGEGTQ